MGRSDGVYIPPKSVYLKFLCGCFVSLTQDKFDIVQFIPTQIKFLATPLNLALLRAQVNSASYHQRDVK